MQALSRFYESAHREILERTRPIIDELRAGERAAFYWLLRDGNWHRYSWVYARFRPCIMRVQAIAVMAGREGPFRSSPWKDKDLIDRGRRVVFQALADSLVKQGACEVRGEGSGQEIRLVKADPDAARLMGVLRARKAQAKARAREWLGNGIRHTPQELFKDLAGLRKGPAEYLGCLLIRRQVAAWFKRQLSK